VRAVKAPYALDEEGQVVTALTAPQHANYTCLACGRPLELRRRPGQRPHFRHLPGAQRISLRACPGETTMHLAAKRLLQEQVRQELEEHGSVVWHLRCAGVEGRCRDHATIPCRLPIEAWDAVELDVAHGSFCFDVAVTSQGRVVFAFELFFEASDAKAEASCVPWLKLLAEDVLRFRPRVPHRSPAEERCEPCKDLAARLAERKAEDKARAKTLAGDHKECPYGTSDGRRRCTGVDKAYGAEARRVAGAWRAVLERARARA
jgi:hypothetical protein